MRKIIIIPVLGLVFTLLISASIFNKRVDYRKGKSKNVCKELRGDVLLYVIFVDTKTTAPWTEFDIQTTMDSINVATNWLRTKALANNIPLTIKTDFFVGEQYSVLKRDLPEETVSKSISTPNYRNGMANMNKWADYIARKAGASFYLQDKDGIPEIKNPKNKERLIAFLRDEHKVESIALMYMVNNYYREDISIPVNILNTDEVEFAVVSYKYPSEISHNLLHLFGAADLYETSYRQSEKNIAFAQQEFPNEIMQNPYAKTLGSLEISDFTKYLIGWETDLDEKYQSLLLDKRARF